MNTYEPMNWQFFKNAFLQNPDKYLQFQYAEGQFVDASFHITEVKQAPIVSVDCGGKMNSWTEVIVQLWEPTESEVGRSMKVSKALSIFQIVEKMLPLHSQATVKIEFGNSKFDTRQMYPGELVADDENLTVNLTPDFTQCKALTRGQSCSTSTSEDVCCTPPKAENPAVEKLELVAVEENCCTPGGGCC